VLTELSDPEEMNDIVLAKLAREIVMNIRNYKEIFKDYGIDEDDYCVIEKNPFFRKVKEAFTIEWNSATSTKDRIALGAAAYLENILPHIVRRAMREDTNLANANDTVKLLLKASGVGEKESEKPSAERFVITINMGADAEDGQVHIETYDKPVAAEGGDDGEIDRPAAPSPAVLELRPTGEGRGEEREGSRIIPRKRSESRPQRVEPNQRSWHTVRSRDGKKESES
jgi:hypothetical protein